MSSMLRNSTLETVLRPFPKNTCFPGFGGSKDVFSKGLSPTTKALLPPSLERGSDCSCDAVVHSGARGSTTSPSRAIARNNAITGGGSGVVSGSTVVSKLIRNRDFFWKELISDYRYRIALPDEFISTTKTDPWEFQQKISLTDPDSLWNSN